MVIYNIIHGAPGAEYYYACIQNKYSVCEFRVLIYYSGTMYWYCLKIHTQ